jgi:glutaredoxin
LTRPRTEEIVVSANVTVFTRADCPPCGLLKEYLDRRGVTDDERDVTEDPRAREELRLSL